MTLRFYNGAINKFCRGQAVVFDDHFAKIRRNMTACLPLFFYKLITLMNHL